MNKKKFTVMTLLLIVVFVLTSCVLFACNPDAADPAKEPEEIEATEGLLISNSDFKVVDTSVTAYPRSMTGWTGAKMYSSGAFRDDVTAGAISLASDLYNANKSKWADEDGTIETLLKAGGRYGDDDKIKNALMIYMPEESKNSDGDKIHGATAFGYTSNSFTLEKGAYYKLSVDVLTYKIGGDNAEDRGARIYITSNTYAEFSAIDTNGEWKTYEVIIETSPSSTTSLTLQLGLGKYSSSYTKGLTTGYAFFDNVVLEKVEDNDETPEVEGKKAYDAAVAKQLEGNKQVTTATLKVPNGTFDFGSASISSSSTPSSWALVTGNSGKSDPAPTSLGYNGVIDLSKFGDNYSKYSPTYQTRSAANTEKNVEYVPAKDLENIVDTIKNYSGRIGNNAFMLSQQLMTAQGIKSSRTITIEKNKTYALSVQLYTYEIHGAGVSLILSGSDGKDIVIKGISSNRSDDVLIGSRAIDPNNQGYDIGEKPGATSGGWTTYTFYIKGNQFKNYNYNMTIWLGTEGTSSNDSVTYHSYTSSGNATTYTANHTFSNGWVFLDDLKLDEIVNLPEAGGSILAANEDQTLDCETSGTALTGLLVDLSGENLFGDILSTGTGTSTLSGVTAIGNGAPTGWTSNFDTSDSTKPVIDGIISEGIVNIADKTAFEALGLDIGAYPELPYDIVNKNAYVLHASKNSSYEADTQEFTIKANHFYRISAWIKTVDVSKSSGAYVYLVDKSKDEDATLTSFTKINTKELDEYHNDWCELTIVVRGAKNKDTNVALRFGLGTGDRWATSTLTSGTLYVANMNMSSLTYANFNDTTTGTYVKSVNLSKSYTYTFTNGSFDEYDLDDENIDPEKALTEQSFAVTPDNFTINDSTLEINKTDSDLFAGIIALNPNPSGKGFVSSTQATSATGIDASVFDSFYNNVAITDGAYAGPNLLAIGAKSEKAAMGFASDKLTLSANTYYQLSVYVKTVNNAKASIFLSGESSATGSSKILVEGSAAGEWTKYTFFIEVGNTSVSLKLNLWFGEDYTMIDSDGSDDEKKEAAKSAGAVFFDNIVYKQIEENEYNETVADALNYKVSFLTDSFDSLSSTIESRKELTKPENWSGAADINQTSSNSKVGIVYADSNYYETENVDEIAYAKLLGLEYKEDDMTVSDTELADAKAKAENAGLSDEQIIAKLKAAKVVEAKKANWIPVSQLKAHSGNSMLVINNTVESAYIYTSGSNTLKENSYYKVSVWVATYGLNEGPDTGANIELYLGSANESTNPFIFKGINTAKTTDNEAGTAAEAGPVWKQYCFYVKTLDDDVTSVTLKLSLGKYISGEDAKITGLTKGYAMFDDVCFETIDADEFDAVTADEHNLTRTVASSNAGTADPDDKDGETTTPKSTFNLDNLWWMIPTIVIALVIIAVVIVLIVRKVRKPVAKKLAKPAPNPVNAEMVEKKLDKYEDGKE